MSKTDMLRHDLDVAIADFDRSFEAGDHAATEVLGVRIAVLQQQLRDAAYEEDVSDVTWDEDGHAGKWAHVADTLALNEE